MSGSPFDWRKGHGRESTQIARAVLCNYLTDLGYRLTSAVKMGDRDARLVELCLEEGWMAGYVLPASGEMLATANALIVRQPRVMPPPVGTAAPPSQWTYANRRYDPPPSDSEGGPGIPFVIPSD